MACILGVGIATLDIINTVERYPAEDAEVRAVAQSLRRGGNVTNTLVVLSQLGHECRWVGTLADDTDSEIIRAELAQYAIDTRAVRTVIGGHAPTSYIALSRENGSRTIVHYRDLPEYSFEDFQRVDLSAVQWLHFEGRNVAETRRMLEHVRAHNTALPVSVEMEKPREGMEQLYGLADVLLYSRQFAEHRGFPAPGPFLAEMRRRYPRAQHVCAWGEQGAFGLDHEGPLLHSPAFPPAQVVDTLGAGDTFNAGFIHARLTGANFFESLRAACELAGRKCGQPGLHGLAASRG
jgi:ketohexokinase